MIVNAITIWDGGMFHYDYCLSAVINEHSLFNWKTNYIFAARFINTYARA